jgi:hypothetical protein
VFSGGAVLRHDLTGGVRASNGTLRSRRSAVVIPIG